MFKYLHLEAESNRSVMGMTLRRQVSQRIIVPKRPVSDHTTIRVRKVTKQQFHHVKPYGITNDKFITLLLTLWTHEFGEISELTGVKQA